MTAPDPRPFLASLFNAAVAAAHPRRCVPAHLPPLPAGRIVVVGAGKGAAAMAAAVEAHWAGHLSRMEGVVVVPDGYAVATRKIQVLEASHPLPDERGLSAGRHILAAVGAATAHDLVLCLLSGGASAVLTVPADGVTLADKQYITDKLLRTGASIVEINTVRKHLSAIKGGRLAAAAGAASLVTLAISDVVGNDPATIGSGPTRADPTTCQDALAVLDRYGIAVSDEIRHGLSSGRLESVKQVPATHVIRVVARPIEALTAAANLARASGLSILDLGDGCEGEAQRVARDHADLAKRIATGTGPVAPPCLVLSGGELTVGVRGSGRGGPNTEYALALATALAGAEGISALAGDSDGSDGAAGAAGAFVLPDTLARARRLGLEPRAALEANDSAGFFGPLGDLFLTGPTFTNVNDIRLILVR